MKIVAQVILFFVLSLYWSQTPEYYVHSMPLCVGDQLSFGNKSIKFKEVVSDSRCPKNPAVTCIWAGEAKVRVEFFQDGKSLGEKVINGNKFSLSDIFKNQFEGSLGYTPYPEVSRKTQPSEYTLELSVTEKTK